MFVSVTTSEAASATLAAVTATSPNNARASTIAFFDRNRFIVSSSPFVLIRHGFQAARSRGAHGRPAQAGVVARPGLDLPATRVDAGGEAPLASLFASSPPLAWRSEAVSPAGRTPLYRAPASSGRSTFLATVPFNLTPAAAQMVPRYTPSTGMDLDALCFRR